MGTYKKQGIGIQRQAGSMEGEAVQPTLGVFEGLEDVLPGKALVVGGIRVGSQAGMDECPLFVVEEPGGVGVVFNEPVCKGRHDDSEESFL